MKVILVKNVPDIGQAGELKNVSDGYARNFLIPRGLAVAATGQALKDFENKQVIEKRRQARAEAENRALAAQVAKMELVFKVRVGEQHRLYGSITNGDIAEALGKKLDRQIDKHHVELEEPLKRLGSFKVPVRLANNVVPEVTVILERGD